MTRPTAQTKTHEVRSAGAMPRTNSELIAEARRLRGRSYLGALIIALADALEESERSK